MEGLSMPGQFPDDISWHDDDYSAVDVELDDQYPTELEGSGAKSASWTGTQASRGAKKAPGRVRKKNPFATASGRDEETAGIPDEFVIVVFGMTGTGKSSFINKLTDQEVGIGHGLNSCTSQIQEVRFNLGGLNVKLVDTPGFDDTTRSDTEVLTLIASWMKYAYTEHTKLTGLIYLHRISDQRMTGSSLKNLRMLRSLCGTQNLSHVTMATTMWDKVSDEEGARREEELTEDGKFWGALQADGARIRRYDHTKGGAMVLVNELLQLSTVVLQIQKEIAIERKTLFQTDAGQSISQDLAMLTKKYETELAGVKEELENAKKEKDAKYEEELKTERRRLQEKVRKAEKDKKALKMPINRKAWYTSSWKCKKCHESLRKERDAYRSDPRGKCPGCQFEQLFV